MAGYDDTYAISRIRELLQDDVSLTRRRAIIGVAGLDNLRRIERKMKEEDEVVPRGFDHEDVLQRLRAYRDVRHRYLGESANEFTFVDKIAGRQVGTYLHLMDEHDQSLSVMDMRFFTRPAPGTPIRIYDIDGRDFAIVDRRTGRIYDITHDRDYSDVDLFYPISFLSMPVLLVGLLVVYFSGTEQVAWMLPFIAVAVAIPVWLKRAGTRFENTVRPPVDKAMAAMMAGYAAPNSPAGSREGSAGDNLPARAEMA